VAESSSSAGRKLKIENDDTQDLAREFDGLNVETDGRISFHGPTSLFQLPSGVVSETTSTTHVAQGLEARKERLINSAWRERAFEQMAAMPVRTSCSNKRFPHFKLTTIDSSIRNHSSTCLILIGVGSSRCLTLSIAQPLPVRLVLIPSRRSLGIRDSNTDSLRIGDMKIQGPYYSDVLMNAVLSHSVRWCKAEPQIGPLLESFEGGAQFYQRAVLGIFDSLKVGYASVPAIQTLLLLSAQECGKGNRTQAWLYSGMAFRVLDDLGISIDSRKYLGAAQLSDEDIEIRNRLFWSCYFWDKIVSLYFGRAPTMQHSRVSPPRMIRKFRPTRRTRRSC
jgi:hypothetical protein